MKKILSVLLGLASLSAFASPEDYPVYFAGSVGATTTYGSNTGAGTGQTATASGGYDVSGTFGVNIIRNLAVEISYANIWNASNSNQWGVSDVAVRGTLPLGNVFSLFGRLGVAGYDNNVNGNSGGAITANTLGVLYGAGGQFNLSRRWALTAEYWNVTGATTPLGNGAIQGGFIFGF